MTTDTLHDIYCEKCERPSVVMMGSVSWEGLDMRYICTEPHCRHVRDKRRSS